MKSIISVYVAAQLAVSLALGAMVSSVAQPAKNHPSLGQSSLIHLNQHKNQHAAVQSPERSSSLQNEASAQQQALERQSANLAKMIGTSSSLAGSPSISTASHQAVSSPNKNNNEQWNLPEGLAKQFTSEPGSSQQMSSYDDASALDDSDDESESPIVGSSSASAPTTSNAHPVDLKPAAGYQYPAASGYHGGDNYGAEGHYQGSNHYGPPSHGYDQGHGYEGHHGGANYGGGHDSGYGGKYFQYASVPYPYAWDFGYRRGNPYHTIERQEHGKGSHFNTKVKWSDKYGGYGVHVWDYNHDDHYGNNHYGNNNYDDDHGHYGGHQTNYHEGPKYGQAYAGHH